MVGLVTRWLVLLVGMTLVEETAAAHWCQSHLGVMWQEAGRRTGGWTSGVEHNLQQKQRLVT